MKPFFLRNTRHETARPLGETESGLDCQNGFSPEIVCIFGGNSIFGRTGTGVGEIRRLEAPGSLFGLMRRLTDANLRVFLAFPMGGSGHARLEHALTGETRVRGGIVLLRPVRGGNRSTPNRPDGRGSRGVCAGRSLFCYVKVRIASIWLRVKHQTTPKLNPTPTTNTPG